MNTIAWRWDWRMRRPRLFLSYRLPALTFLRMRELVATMTILDLVPAKAESAREGINTNVYHVCKNKSCLSLVLGERVIEERVLVTLKEILPQAHNYIICSCKGNETEFDAVIRADITEQEQAVNWKATFESKQRQLGILKGPTQEEYRCQHNTKSRSSKADSRRSSKNTNCMAKLQVTVNNPVVSRVKKLSASSRSRAHCFSEWLQRLDDGVLEMGDQEKFDVPSSTADSFSGVCLETLQESCNALLSDDCISDSTKDIIRNIDGPALLQDLQFLNQCLVKKGRFKTAAREKAYSNFNREFVNHSQDVERLIPSPASAWVCLKVFELKVNKNYNLPLSNQASSISEVTDDEVDIVQYIAGYVLHSVKRRALKLSHTEREDSLLCIKELIPEDDTASEPAERSLTQILDRGGLIKLKPPVLQVFIKLESIFRQCFDGQMQTLSFDLYFTNCCQAESVSTCLYEQMYSILASQKIKENILFMIVKSYFMVRALHKCKKFMENFKLSRRTSSKKQKGLRKGLKTTSSNV